MKITILNGSPKAAHTAAMAKAALLLSSESPGVYDGAIGTYKAMLAYTGLKDMGIVTAQATPRAALMQSWSRSANSHQVFRREIQG